MAKTNFDELELSTGLAAGSIGAGAITTAKIADGALSADATGRGKMADGFVTLAKVSPGTLDGTVAKTTADANVVGGIPVLHRIDVPDAATGDVDVVLTHKTRVVDAWAVKTAANGGAANTFQVKNGADAITNALDMNVNDQTVVRAGTIDDAQHEIAAGGTLRVTRTKAGGNAAGVVYVAGLRVA